MKNLLVLFCALWAASLPLFSGEETPLGEKDFILGKFVIDGGEVEVTCGSGVFTIEIPEQPGLSNETRGAVFRLPLQRLLGKGMQIRAHTTSCRRPGRISRQMSSQGPSAATAA